MSQVVVFDFDKTLTYDDTLLSYFLFVGREKPLFTIRFGLFFFLMVIKKLKVINLEQLKSFGVRLFLGYRPDTLEVKSRDFARTIRFSSLYREDFQKSKSQARVIIMSASLDTYLKYVFPEVEVVCSTLAYRNGRPYELSYHCYSSEKATSLKRRGISEIGTLYTDSISDLSLAKMASRVYLVDGDTKTECLTLMDFIKACKSKKRGSLDKMRYVLRTGLN